MKPGQRTSYYNREDIHRLKSRSLAHSGHGPAAASVPCYWGERFLKRRSQKSPGWSPYRDCPTDLAETMIRHPDRWNLLDKDWPPENREWTISEVPASLTLEFGKIDPSDFRHIFMELNCIARENGRSLILTPMGCYVRHEHPGVMAGAFWVPRSQGDIRKPRKR